MRITEVISALIDVLAEDGNLEVGLSLGNDSGDSRSVDIVNHIAAGVVGDIVWLRERDYAGGAA